MDIPLVSGRYLTADDDEESLRVVLISEEAAERAFPGQDPLGRRLLITDDQPWEVVGVVGDVRHRSLEEGGGAEVYIPYTQLWDMSTAEMVVRSRLPVSALSVGVREAIRAVDPAIPTDDVRSMEDVVNRAVSPRRFTLALLGGFAGAALILAALGLYAVLSYTVSQRIPEIGIRMALGESAASVRRRIVGRTLVLASVGVALGAGTAFLLGRLIATLLYGVGATDVATFSVTVAVLLGMAFVAGYVPARRASRVDPVEALRAG
jgi:ABC-type antimicrobial peptide transport system permease subunit